MSNFRPSTILIIKYRKCSSYRKKTDENFAELWHIQTNKYAVLQYSQRSTSRCLWRTWHWQSNRPLARIPNTPSRSTLILQCSKLHRFFAVKDARNLSVLIQRLNSAQNSADPRELGSMLFLKLRRVLLFSLWNCPNWRVKPTINN